MKKIIAEDKWGWPVEEGKILEEKIDFFNDDRVSQESVKFVEDLGMGINKLPKFFEEEIWAAEFHFERLQNQLDKVLPLAKEVLALADIKYGGTGRDSAGPDILTQRLSQKQKALIARIMDAASKQKASLSPRYELLDYPLISDEMDEVVMSAESLVNTLERIKYDLEKMPDAERE